MAMDYAKESKQEIVIIQRDVEKYYDHVSWSSVAQIMFHMGFGARMLIFHIGVRYKSTCYA